MDEMSLGGDVFLSLRELVWWSGENLSDPPLWWWLSPIYSGLGPLPKCWREGITQRPDLKGDKQYILS